MREPAKQTRLKPLTEDSIDASNWISLFESLADARFYHHPDWFLAINQNLLPGQVQLAYCQDEHQSFAIMPWITNGRDHRLKAPRHDHLSLCDVLLSPELDQRQAMAAVESTFDQVACDYWDYQLDNLPNRSPLFNAIEHNSQWKIRQSRQSAWFDLSAEDCPPGGRLRRNLKRLRGKLEATGQIRFDWITEPSQIEEAFVHFAQLEAAGWKGQSRHSTAIAHNPALLGFYRRLLTPSYPGLQPVVTLLWSDSSCIAAQLGMITGSTLSLLKIAYSEDFANYSPGSLLLQDVMSQAIENSLQTLSLVTCPPWAERWHPQTEPVWHATGFAKSSGGMALSALYRLKQSVRNRLKPGS